MWCRENDDLRIQRDLLQAQLASMTPSHRPGPYALCSTGADSCLLTPYATPFLPGVHPLTWLNHTLPHPNSSTKLQAITNAELLFK